MSRARPRVGCYPGCIGCSIPLLILAAAAVLAVTSRTGPAWPARARGLAR